MSTHRTARRVLAVALAAVTLLLTGCMDTSVNVALTGDGSGDLDVSVTMNEMLSSMMLAQGGTDELAEGLHAETGVPAELADRVRFDVTEADGRVSIEMSFAFEDPTELSDVLAPGGESSLFETFSLTDDADGWRLDASYDFEALAGELSGVQDAAGEVEGVDMAELEAMFGGAPGAEFSITFPGDVTESNSTDVDGATARWDLTAGDGTMTATSTGSSGSPLALLVPAAVVAILAIAVVAVVVARRNNGSVAAAGPAEPWVPQQPTAPYAGVNRDAQWAANQPVITPVDPTATASRPAAGWYADPSGNGVQRWWDGERWTDHTA